jgi:hypothetical protein
MPPTVFGIIMSLTKSKYEKKREKNQQQRGLSKM